MRQVCCPYFRGAEGSALPHVVQLKREGVTFFFTLQEMLFIAPNRQVISSHKLKFRAHMVPMPFTLLHGWHRGDLLGTPPGCRSDTSLVLLLVFLPPPPPPGPVLFSVFPRMLSILRAVDDPCTSQGPDRSQKPCWMFEQRKLNMRSC